MSKLDGLKSKQVGESIEFKNAIQKTTQLFKNKGSTINIEEVDQILASMRKVALQQKKTMVITRIFVVNGDKKASYKDMDEFMEYYEGRVKDVDKFHEFYQVDITTTTSK